MAGRGGDTGASAPYDGPDAPDLRLCSWNVKKLGHGSTKNYEATASVLEDHCDASVIVEVMQKGGTHPGYEDLMAALGSGWTGVVTEEPRPNTTDGYAEFYAVVWRTGVLSQCEGWDGLRYIVDNDGSDTDEGDDHFSREPAYGCFVLQGGGSRFDFLLAAYHATFESSASIHAEASRLTDVAAEMRASRPGEGDILILGDFNLVPSKLAAATTLEDWTTGTGSTLNSTGAITGNLYDHVLVASTPDSPELGEKAEVLDVRGVTTSPKAFFDTVSDHLPIRTTLSIVGPDDD